MYVARVTFTVQGSPAEDDVTEAVENLHSSWRMNGQLYGREWGLAAAGQWRILHALIPEADSLEETHANQWVQKDTERLAAVGMAGPEVEIVGEDQDSAAPCTCSSRGSYILYTDYLALESPLHCGECFAPIPLYRIPPTYHGNYYDIICWSGDYEDCDALQMRCATLERAATREMSRLDSSLSRQGLEVCARICEATGLPVYYYLYRYNGRSLRQERLRKCPSCGGEWLLPERWQHFDFRCDRCRLLSNIAWNVLPYSPWDQQPGAGSPAE